MTSNRRNKISFARILIAVIMAGSAACPAHDAWAFSRGMAAKVRQMRENAFAERMNGALGAFKAGRFEECVRAATLALEHASDESQASAAHHLIASSYLQLGNPAAAAPHQAWLAQRQK